MLTEVFLSNGATPPAPFATYGCVSCGDSSRIPDVSRTGPATRRIVASHSSEAATDCPQAPPDHLNHQERGTDTADPSDDTPRTGRASKVVSCSTRRPGLERLRT